MARNRKNTRHTASTKIALGVATVLHIFGVAGLLFSKGLTYQLVLDLVPINLIITTLLALKFNSQYDLPFFKFAGAAFLIGFGIEVIGVNTGWPFGQYQYGETLGISVWNTPVLIGLNWFLVCYGVGSLLGKFKFSGWIKWILSIVLLVFLDYFIEPVAVRHQFWAWTSGNIPVTNYLGWAMVSGIIMGFYFFYLNTRKNEVAAGIWLIQLGFFVLQNLF